MASVRAALEGYKILHPRSEIECYRHNSVSIRSRIIDPDFAHQSAGDRHDRIWTFLEGLPDALLSQVTLLLLLTPEELPRSFANIEFEDPIPSRL